MPLEIASTPVSAVHPEAKACSTSSKPTVAVWGGSGAVCPSGICGRWPVSWRTTPTSNINAQEPTNR
jgi:hypothetical protein